MLPAAVSKKKSNLGNRNPSYFPHFLTIINASLNLACPAALLASGEPRLITHSGNGAAGLGPGACGGRGCGCVGQGARAARTAGAGSPVSKTLLRPAAVLISCCMTSSNKRASEGRWPESHFPKAPQPLRSPAWHNRAVTSGDAPGILRSVPFPTPQFKSHWKVQDALKCQTDE